MDKKAIALLSGGLDSTLTIRLLLDQGIEIVALNFTSPFCQCNRKNSCQLESKKVAEKLDVKLKVIGLGKEYLEMVKSPKYGYGKNMNPCIDCRILMFKKAKSYMEEIKASFMITGEVLGQRPMSQHRKAMELIEKEAGLEGLILRPLSAQVLNPTLPEKIGIINRDKLLNIRGRSRRPQIKLALHYKINDYLCPAGGCLLTDPIFAKKLRDLLNHLKNPLWRDIKLLKIGRHFRVSNLTKVIVGRNKDENEQLLKLAKKEDSILKVTDYTTPVVIIQGRLNEEVIQLASKITVRYSDAPKEIPVTVLCQIDRDESLRKEIAIEESQLENMRI
ncbi:7-cyano-7-deazaguanine synthase [bacterium]|nr:7-cyano-7-deazaguanine synthase [bacterium]